MILDKIKYHRKSSEYLSSLTTFTFALSNLCFLLLCSLSLLSSRRIELGLSNLNSIENNSISNKFLHPFFYLNRNEIKQNSRYFVGNQNYPFQFISKFPLFFFLCPVEAIEIEYSHQKATSRTMTVTPLNLNEGNDKEEEFQKASCHSSSSSSSTTVNASNAIDFLRTVGRLKLLKRTGWVNNNIDKPESVADHMYRMSMASFLITDPSIDKTRLMRIAIVHDLAESLVGDIVPHDRRYTKEDKYRMEDEAMKKITQELGNEEIGKEIYNLWKEYEDQSTPESHIVKDFDKFEMILQADEYEQSQGKKLDDFFSSTEGVFTHPEVQGWDSILRNERKQRQDEEDDAR